MKAAERKQIHSIYCELKGLEQHLSPVVKSHHINRLKNAADRLFALIEEEVRQEDDINDKRYEQLSDRQDALNIHTIMSMNGADGLNVSLEDLTKKPFFGKNVTHMTYDGETIEVSPEMTLEELWVAADKVRRLARDEHHVFLEALTLKGTVLHAVFGS